MVILSFRRPRRPRCCDAAGGDVSVSGGFQERLFPGGDVDSVSVRVRFAVDGEVGVEGGEAVSVGLLVGWIRGGLADGLSEGVLRENEFE